MSTPTKRDTALVGVNTYQRRYCFGRCQHLNITRCWHLPKRYDSLSDVGEIRVYQRADFQSGSRVLKKVFWTLSYLYLWHTMWFHAKKLLKTLKFWKSLNSLCKSGSRPQKSPKKAQKTDHSIAIYSNFWIGMVYFGYHLVKAHVQTVQNMYGKGG